MKQLIMVTVLDAKHGNDIEHYYNDLDFFRKLDKP